MFDSHSDAASQVDENGWSILRVDKLVEDTEAWDQVQLRPGLLVDTVTTYDGEDYSCRDISTAELIEKIDSPQRPLKITFRDPEFDTAEAKALAEQRKAAQDTAKSKKIGNDATLSEGTQCGFASSKFASLAVQAFATNMCPNAPRSSACKCRGVQCDHRG